MFVCVFVCVSLSLVLVIFLSRCLLDTASVNMQSAESLRAEEEGDDAAAVDADDCVEPHISTRMIVKATPTRRLKGEPLDKLLKRLTHLNLQDSNVTIVVRRVWCLRVCWMPLSHPHPHPHPLQDGLDAVPNLKVLYLYDNRIEAITGLHSVSKLTHLYLQNNKLSSVDGLQSLVNLSKLCVARPGVAV